MRQLFLLSLATLAACVAPPLANAHPAGDVSPPRVLVVEGSGEAAARADMATIRLGVRSFAPSAAAAMSETNRKAAATLKSLGKAGVADRDITTTGLSLNARYDYGQNRQEPRISGYEASNNVTVRLRDIDKVGAILDKALNAGANQMNGISFGFADPTSLYDEARANAIADAKRKASVYADAAGVDVGDILTISDTNAPIREPMRMMRAEAATADSIPISVGENSVQARVRIVFELK